MKQPLFIRLDLEQIEHVKKQPNQSVYIGNLIKADQHRETRSEYVFQLISDMVLNEPDIVVSITKLTRLLTDSITGEDVLNEIMEGGHK
jgi:hypothetical protein